MKTHMETQSYRYHDIFYTGTETQPDSLNFFVKMKKGENSFLAQHAMPLANWMGYMPIIGSFTGVARIINSVKTIFENFSQNKTSEKQTIYKNFFRGFVEVLPFTGVSLMLFDAIRIRRVEAKIKKEVQEQENIVGLAMDGNLMFTVGTIGLSQLEKLRTKPSWSNEDRLRTFTFLCLKFLEKKEKEGRSPQKMKDIFPKLQEIIQQIHTIKDLPTTIKEFSLPES